MLQLFYLMGDNNWDNGVIKNIKAANFSQGFKISLPDPSLFKPSS